MERASDKLIEEIASKLCYIQQEARLEAYREIMDGTVFVVDNVTYLITTERALFIAKNGKSFECCGDAVCGIPNNCPKVVLDFFFGKNG